MEKEVIRTFLPGKSTFFVKLPEKNKNFRKFALKIEIFVKLYGKDQHFSKHSPGKIEFFLSGFTTPQNSNQVDAAAGIVLYLSIYIAPLNSHGQTEVLLVN